MIPDYETAKRYADWYREFLRVMKADGLTLDDMPGELHDSMLAMQQNAIAVAEVERQARKAERRKRRMLNA